MISRRLRRARAASCALLACAIALGAAAGCGIDVIGTAPIVSSTKDATAVESGESDAGIILTPPADAGADVTTGAPGFCAGQAPYFACWDFDGLPAGGDAGFTGELDATGVIGIVIDGTNPVLQATLPAGGGSRSSWVSYGISTNGGWKAGYTLDFKVGVRQSGLSYVAVGALFTTSATDHAIGAASYSSGLGIDTIAPDSTLLRVVALPGTTWHQASVALAGMPNRLHATVVVDGLTVDDEPTLSAGQLPMTGVALRLGAYFTSVENAGATVVFDDIVVRTK